MNTQEEEKWPEQDSKQSYVSVSMLARHSGINRRTIQKEIVKGRIAAIKIPSHQNQTGFEFRVALEDANAYISEKLQDATPQDLGPLSEKLGPDESQGSDPRGTPDCCGSCGATTGNILGDVNDETGQAYGYLCFRCYKLVTAFHGDPLRMRKVLVYIEKTRPENIL